MTPEGLLIRREELYEQVWAEPMIRLAQRYGLSGVGLAKICRKMAVPAPPRGYWQRKKFGNALPRPPLPALRDGIRGAVTITPHPRPAGKPEGTSERTPATPRPAEDSIPVPDRLTRPHPLIRLSRAALRRGKVDEYRVLRPDWKERCLHIRVAKTSLSRALRIMDALIKALDARGLPVRLADDAKQGTYAEVGGEKVQIVLEEAIHRTEHVPTQKEIEEQKRWSWNHPKPWDFAPTALLRLRIKEVTGDRSRKLWSDGKRRRLEELLSDFLGGIRTAAEAKRRQREEWEREQREWREAAERQAELERQRREEEARRQVLERQTELWLKTQNLRAYIDAVERAATNRGTSAGPGTELQRWLGWARKHADRLDPLKEVLPSDMLGGTAGASGG